MWNEIFVTHCTLVHRNARSFFHLLSNKILFRSTIRYKNIVGGKEMKTLSGILMLVLVLCGMSLFSFKAPRGKNL